MRTTISLLLFVLSFLPLRAHSQLVPPCPGVEIPQAYYDRVAVDKNAFQFQKAWIQKAERANEARRAFLAAHGNDGLSLASIPMGVRSAIAVTGTVQVPVFLGAYSNTGTPPYAASALETKLFSPPPALSITGLYHEMSYGNVTLTGTVYDWFQVLREDTYYEGGCQGICAAARTGQFLLELLEAHDPTVDFGVYDNDGPDGMPNSGDDDGFVDFVAFVHPESGAECGTTNIWSHRWVVGGWPEFGATGTAYGPPWQTNDESASGGFIKVWDYVIQPALGSENGCGAGMIEIGVFCHEFGHAFGLPDLYDDGSEGAGHWGLMGSGNWNKPTNPAHMSAWSKAELGWVLPTEIGPSAQVYTIDNVETTPEVFKLPVMEQKFSRKLVTSSFRLYCGLTAEEATLRRWPKGAGYGNSWDEQIQRDFTYDGTNPVTLEYDFMHDTELGYDYGYMMIDVNGAVSTLAEYTGFGAGHAVIDLTPYLSGSGASTYRLIARFVSDYWASDEDGDFDAGAAGPYMIDNVSVSGGGESYFANFEQHEGGWYYDFAENPSKEYFLVENRNATGAQFDQFLHGQGLAVWHIEQNMMAPMGLGNTGGSANTTIRGVTLEEADGRTDLLFKMNRGDGGDIFPGTSSNTSFTNATTPNSLSYNGDATHVLLTGISAAGPQMTATARAGLLPPSVTSIDPVFWYNDQPPKNVEVAGQEFVHGAVFFLRDGASTEYMVGSAKWWGRSLLAGSMDLSAVPAGVYDVVVRNPDGQEAVLSDGFLVKRIVPVFIQTFGARPTDEGIELEWEIWSDEEIDGFRISRRLADGSGEVSLHEGRLIDPDRRSFFDDSVQPGTEYQYALVVVFKGGTDQVTQEVRATSAAFALRLSQNSPNPFNPSTRIAFTLPEAMRATITVYDAAGRRIATLVDETRPAGKNEAGWDGTSSTGEKAASGVYFYRLTTERGVLTKKMLLLK